MIIANQDKNLFKNIKTINDVVFIREEIDFEFYFENGTQKGKPIYQYQVKVNGKIYAKYDDKSQFETVKQDFINSLFKSIDLFIFPVIKPENMVINYAS